MHDVCGSFIVQDKDSRRCPSQYQRVKIRPNNLKKAVPNNSPNDNKQYTLSEVMYAGILLTEGIDGTYSDNYFSGKGKYVRIDDHDIVVIRDEMIFTEDVFFEGGCFYADSGEKYHLRPRNKKK